MDLIKSTSATFWISQALIIGSLSLIAYLCGLLVRHGNVLVNYTRKVNFFALFLIPNLVSYLALPGVSRHDHAEDRLLHSYARSLRRANTRADTRGRHDVPVL